MRERRTGQFSKKNVIVHLIVFSWGVKHFEISAAAFLPKEGKS